MNFRRLTDDDLVQLYRWLNEPGVVLWWEGDDVSWAGVVRDYGSSSSEPTEYWIATAAGRDVGWIQCYATAAYADEDEVKQWWALGIDHTAAGIDYLIGEPGERGRGLGTRMIREFVSQVVFGLHPHWTQVCASPVAANIASWQALQAAGFSFVGEFDSAFGPCRLMAADRPDRVPPS